MLLILAFFASSLAASAVPLGCRSQTQPNPITKDFPEDVTGVINGTTAIVPIPYAVARSIIPSQYPILTAAYQKVFPTLQSSMYPAVLEAVQDHDVGQPPLKIPDFTVSPLTIQGGKKSHSRLTYTAARRFEVSLRGPP